jgi:membrane fusion protein, copper/silver efflux system
MNPKSKATWTTIFSLILIIAAFLLSGAGHLGCSRHTSSPGGEQAILYTCPMHPQYTSDRPGTCPICGMTLVPVKREPTPAPAPQAPEGPPPAAPAAPPSQGGAAPGASAMPGMEMKAPEGAPPSKGGERAAVMLDEAQQRRIGVTTAEVTKGPAMVEIRAAGRVAFDQDLVVAQREFLEARKAGDREIAQAAGKRLLLMGMSDEQVKELVRRGKPEEALLLPGKTAWIYATIYERELPSVREGQAAAIVLPDGTQLGTGTVRAVDPVLNPQTRSARARIEVGNAARQLRPNMFVTAILKRDLGERLLVPKSAVIDSGTRKLVFLVHEGKHFMPREVVLGPELPESYVVDAGLASGDVVATAALFLIDSESQLKAAAGAASAHHHD